MGRPRERPRGGTSWPRTRATTLVRPLAAVSPRYAERPPRGWIAWSTVAGRALAAAPRAVPTIVSPVLVTHDAYDPPDIMLRPTARGLFGLWRDEWRLASLGLLSALRVTISSLAIPLLVQRAIDHAIVPRARRQAVAVPGRDHGARGHPAVRQLPATVPHVAGRHPIENEMRRRLFAAYLTYPRAFYDRHATGQVLSRATNDLYPVRYFIGWGVIQMCQSAMMIVGASIVLLTVNPLLAVCAGVAMPAVAYLTWRFAHLVTPISRVVQQRQADLTESADEAVRRHRDGAGLRPRAGRARSLRRARARRARRDAAGGARRGHATCRCCCSCRRSRSPRCSRSAATS